MHFIRLDQICNANGVKLLKESIHVPFICLSVMFLLSAWIHTSVCCVFQDVFLLFWTNLENDKHFMSLEARYKVPKHQKIWCVYDKGISFNYKVCTAYIHLLKRTWYIEMHTKTHIEILSVRKVITSGVNLMHSLNDIDNLFKSSYEKTHENSILIIIAYDRIKLLTTLLCRIFYKIITFP